MLEDFNHRYMNAVELESSLIHDKFQISMYQYDLNDDGLTDYLIQDKADNKGACGSIGCPIDIFLLQQNGMRCQKIAFTYFDEPYGKLGIGENKEIFIQD